MYHGRFTGTHYDTGHKWGSLLRKNGKKIDYCPTFELTEDKYAFAKEYITEKTWERHWDVPNVFFWHHKITRSH